MRGHDVRPQADELYFRIDLIKWMRNYVQMEALAAIAEPTRRRIVEMLAGRELAAGEIGAEFAISAPALSQHLKVLKEANLVRARVDGQRRIYALDPAGFTEIEAWLSQLRRFWLPRLDALEEQLTRHKDGRAKRRRRRKP